MDRVEERLHGALRARADLVTEESLRPAVELATDRRRSARRMRWPVVVAAVGTVAAVAVAIAVVNVEIRSAERGPAVAPPSVSSAESAVSEPPSAEVSASGSAGPGTSSAKPSSAAPPKQTGGTTAPPACAGEPCKLVQTARIAGDTLQLWSSVLNGDPNKGEWQILVGGVRVPGGPSFSSFASDGSLRCATVAGTPVCLVYTHNMGDSDTSVGLEKRNGSWRYTGATFKTPMGAERIEIKDLYDNGSIEVVAVERNHIESGGAFTAQVWRWNGSRLGCTPHVDAKEQLPNWPDVRPEVSTLAIANCFWG